LDTFPADITFKFDWRVYQRRALKALEEHLGDNHLHIVAPPGSGKTVLGLEVAIRLDKPTLILAPTLAIRDQWIHLFCEQFLQIDHTPEWVSRDIRRPAFLTVSTYQGLHAAYINTAIEQEQPEEEEEELNDIEKPHTGPDLIQRLKSQAIGTIVVDEAHHLKNAWWKSLTAVKQALDPTIVGLTATPPYDVSYAEWRRYIELNGPVDAEISVPELVAENNLCPHQDYVILSGPNPSEYKRIVDIRTRVQKVYDNLLNDNTIIDSIVAHPALAAPTDHLEWIYTHLECYSASLIFLNAVDVEIDKKHLEVIGDKKLVLPEFDLDWAEVLLRFYLFDDDFNHFQQNSEYRKEVFNRLNYAGLLNGKQVQLRHIQRIRKLLTNSLGKLESIERIIRFEQSILKEKLRLVVLTDYIRKEFLVNSSENNLELNKLGVMPIFERIRRAGNIGRKISILTGSIVIVPASSADMLEQLSIQSHLTGITTTPLSYDRDFILVKAPSEEKHAIVKVVTAMFEQGGIEVLIGTKALLGEGWDAPCINSLILASVVGSYVSSNQMRGRAIRVQAGNQEKTSAIWHLASVDLSTYDGGDEIQLLKRRFKSFVGVSMDGDTRIENGFDRLQMTDIFLEPADIEKINTQMLDHAINRDMLKQRWQDALAHGVSMVEEITIPFPQEKNYREVKQLYFNRTIAYTAATLVSGLLAFGGDALYYILRSIDTIRSLEDVYRILFEIGILGVILFGGITYKTLRMYLKYRDISDDIHQIAESLLQSLIKSGYIKTDFSELEVVSRADKAGGVHCHLEGGTVFEKSVFIESLQEILGPVDNPRYIILRKNRLLKFIDQVDYHAVPERLGQKKQFAVHFKDQWLRKVGACKLVYTRTMEGRKLLLKSRLSSLSAEFEEKTDRIQIWR